MKHTGTETIQKLPLSWARTNTKHPNIEVVQLPFGAQRWIPTAEIPRNYSFEQVFQEVLNPLQKGFVLQSCSLELRNFLIQQGCQAVAMGAEAVLELPWRGKRSVRELARRGARHGAVREVRLSATHQKKLIQLANQARPRQGITLQHTERTKIDDTTRCFVFETPGGDWLGAITLSANSPGYMHTEQLLRRSQAPVGVMEALISTAANQLTGEGITQFSLGAVTPTPATETESLFEYHRHQQEVWVRRKILFQLSNQLHFVHNPAGLWKFKNKFSSRWEPLYLCGFPELSLGTIIGMVHKTGFSQLAWHHLLEAVPRPPTLPRLRLPGNPWLHIHARRHLRPGRDPNTGPAQGRLSSSRKPGPIINR